MKSTIFLICFWLFFYNSKAQKQKQLTLEEIHSMALQHYPLVKKYDLINKSHEYSIENASKGYYPRVSLHGQAIYQSDVTSIPVELPNMSIEPPAKDQYKIYAEINQNLYSGGRIRSEIQMEQAKSAIEEKQLEVELYSLKERIYQLYFGILLLEKQQEQTELTKKEIQSGIKKTRGAIENGTALKSNLYVLEAELLKTKQRSIEQKASWKAYANMLERFTNLSIDTMHMLAMPQNEAVLDEITRPELKLYDLQQETLNVRQNMLNALVQPQIGLFLQGGYGRPGLNMLSNDFEPYYVGGIRFSWALTGLYTYKNKKQLLSVDRQKLDIEKETFLFNISLSLQQQKSEIQKFQELIEAGREMLELRERILATANAQLENGIITANDYLSYVIDEEEARQNLLLHQIQFLMATYNFNTIAGN